MLIRHGWIGVAVNRQKPGAAATLEQQEAGLKAGADAYLVKSKFEQGDLLRVIRSVV